MKVFLNRATAHKIMLLSMFLFVPSIHAVVEIPQNVHIGTLDQPHSLTVTGLSHLRGDTFVGTADTAQDFKVWGDASVSGNTTVNQHGPNRCIMGMIENFNPHEHQLAIDFTNIQEGSHGAMLELNLSSVGHGEGPETFTTHFKGLFIHPNTAENCFDVEGVTRIDENTGDDSVDTEFTLDPVFRQNNVNRMCVGLAYYTSPEETDTPTPFNFYNNEEYVDPGCLFYKITSPNLSSVSRTATHNLELDTLDQSIQDMIISLTDDINAEEAVAVALLAIDSGAYYNNIFLDLNPAAQLSFLTQLFDNLSLKSVASKAALDKLIADAKAQHKAAANNKK